jgi:hypothetical protein
MELLISILFLIVFINLLIACYTSKLFRYLYNKYLDENPFLEMNIVILVGFTSPIFIFITLIYNYLYKNYK